MVTRLNSDASGGFNVFFGPTTGPNGTDGISTIAKVPTQQFAIQTWGVSFAVGYAYLAATCLSLPAAGSTSLGAPVQLQLLYGPNDLTTAGVQLVSQAGHTGSGPGAGGGPPVPCVFELPVPGTWPQFILDATQALKVVATVQGGSAPPSVSVLGHVILLPWPPGAVRSR